MKIIAIANQKGGVAKTATAGALSAALTRKGYSVLAIDMDPQANLTDIMGGTEDGESMYEVMKGEASLESIIQHTKMGDLAPSELLLAGLELELTKVGREFKLREAIRKDGFGEKYDYIIIDTPPSLGLITTNALAAAHYVIVPCMADKSSLKGIKQLNDTIQAVKEYINSELEMAGIVFTRFEGYTNIGRDVRNVGLALAEELDTIVFNQAIRKSVVLPEANAQAKDLWEHDEKSTVAQDYAALTDELLDLLKEVK